MDGVVLPAATKKTVTIAPLPEHSCENRQPDCGDSGNCEDAVNAGEASCEVDSHDDSSSDKTTSTSGTDSSHSSVTKTNGDVRSSGDDGQSSEVQAFLEDSDNVLEAVERCQAEDKCLMLIKRPKESARKMLKSHSLTQMSVSDPQLYRQFNGLHLTQVHQHAQTVSPSHQDEPSETQSTTSNSTEGTEPRRCYAGVKDRLLKQSPPYSGTRRPPDYHRPDSSPTTSDLYQYLPRRDLRDPLRRDLRYSSIPEDEDQQDQEINNNNNLHQHKGSSGGQDSSAPGQSGQGSSGHYGHSEHSPRHREHSLSHSEHSLSHSQHSLSHSEHSPHSTPQHGSSHRQGRSCPTYQQAAQSLQAGSSHSSDRSSLVLLSALDSREAAGIGGGGGGSGVGGGGGSGVGGGGGGVVDTRPQSMNGPSPGMTAFSLVGQRKAGVTFSSPVTQRPQTVSNRQGAAGDGDPYRDTPASADIAARSYSRPLTNGHYSPRGGRDGGDRGPAPGVSNGSDHHSGVHSSPSHHHPHHPLQHHPLQHHHLQHHPLRQPVSNGEQHPQHLMNGEVEGSRGSQQYSSGHGYSPGTCGVSLQGAPLTVLSPLRVRTNLAPVPAPVPAGETSDRLKRYTEVMRCRTSLSSCGDMSTTSSMSHTPSTPHTPPSRQSSATENGWDSEVSTLLEVRLGDGGSSSPAHQRPPGQGRAGCDGGKKGALTAPDKVTHLCAAHETPNLCGDQHSDGGQTSSTSHSHSSTMDSGYTTNTEGECDSSLNPLSPPYHPSYPHPVHTPHVQPEPYRPVPMPRNLFPTHVRKCNSLHSSGSTPHHYHQQQQQQQQQPHHSPGPSFHCDAKSRVKSSPSQQKRAVSHCIQVNGHPVDQAASDQRPGWDSASSFKSLDLAPAAGAQADTAASSGDDLVLKPHVVARSGSCADKAFSPSRASDTDHRSSGGGDSAGSSTKSRPPSNPPAPDTNSVITVPGHWNHNNSNDGNVLNNNNPANSNSSNNNSSSSSNNSSSSSNSGVASFPGSPRTHPRPGAVKTTPLPTLFQLSQGHDLCSARLLLTPGTLCAGSVVTLTSVQVTLPPLHAAAESGSASQSPQGLCARIGGPGSAFRPVRAGSAAQTTELTAVESVEEQAQQHVTAGELQAGDLLLEVNGWQCMGHDTAGIQTVLDTTQDVTLVVARKRKETSNNRVQELESSVHKLEEEVGRLAEDLSQKDARLQELSSLLPWTQGQQNGETTLVLQSDEEGFVIGENEFVV